MNMEKNIEGRIAQLQKWDRVEMIAEWERLYKKTAPIRISKILMIRAISYKWQEEIFSGLSKNVQNFLDRTITKFKRDPSVLTASLQIKAGTRLRRLWQGKIYEVIATTGGFVYEGNTYKSLSEIARVITGTRWNGLVFFGLKESNGGVHGRATA